MTLSKARFVFLFPFFLQVLLVNLVLRLCLFHLGGVYSLGQLPEILFWGMTQDMVFFTYFAIPLVIYLLVTPQDAFVSPSNLGTLYFFNAVSSVFLASFATLEFLFWKGHHSRFYEGFSPEALTPLVQEHTLLLITSILFGTLILWCLFYRFFRFYFKKQKMVFPNLRFRLLPALFFLALPCLCTYFFHYKKYPTMPVETFWEKEQLKMNGSFQLIMTKISHLDQQK